jgi:hypothetical protein
VPLVAWLVLGPVVAVALAAAAARWLLRGPARREHWTVLAILVAVVEASIVPLLALAALSVPYPHLMCPTDARCRGPFPWVALVGSPLLVALSVVVLRAGRRRDWSMSVMVPVAVGLVAALGSVVAAGFLPEVVVPRP